MCILPSGTARSGAIGRELSSNSTALCASLARDVSEDQRAPDDDVRLGKVNQGEYATARNVPPVFQTPGVPHVCGSKLVRKSPNDGVPRRDAWIAMNLRRRLARRRPTKKPGPANSAESGQFGAEHRVRT